MKGVPVLMYHGLETLDLPAGACNQGEQIYILPVSKFREQMLYLHNNGFKTLLFEELLVQENWPEKAVVITFDDGHESNYTLALPILQEFGFKAEFFITTNWIGTSHYLTIDQLAALNKAGMGIGSHGVTHSYFNDMSKEEIETELIKSQEALSNIIKNPVASLSVPGGRCNREVVILAQQTRYNVVCTSTYDIFTKKHTFYEIPRIPIQHKTSLAKFIRLVNRDLKLLIRYIIKNQVLDITKKIIGIDAMRNYEKEHYEFCRCEMKTDRRAKSKVLEWKMKAL